MKMRLFAAVCVSLVVGATCLARQDVAADASRLELQGQFKQAASLLTTALRDQSLPAAERQKLEFELDRLDRIKQDFPLTKEALFTDLKDSVKNFTAAEYEQWLKEGRFDCRDIDGTRFFMGDSVRNLYMRYPELEARRIHPKNTSDLDKASPGVRPLHQERGLGREDTLRSAQALSRHHDRHRPRRRRTRRRNHSRLDSHPPAVPVPERY